MMQGIENRAGNGGLAAIIKAIRQLKENIDPLDLPPADGSASEFSMLAASVADLARVLRDR